MHLSVGIRVLDHNHRPLIRSIAHGGAVPLSPLACGKSQFFKLLGKETDRPVLILHAETLTGSLDGQTEEPARQALRIIEAMAPRVLTIDEAEKGVRWCGLRG
jgi:hypothetical protein